MIDISGLRESDKGRGVIYTATRERGVISSWNEFYIFVRYGSRSYSQATTAKDLSWESEVADEQEAIA